MEKQLETYSGTVQVSDGISLPAARYLLLSGPCVIESQQLCLDVAGVMQEICRDLGIDYVFKASFDKANRTAASSFRVMEWMPDYRYSRQSENRRACCDGYPFARTSR